jgi:hypothetical protein
MDTRAGPRRHGGPTEKERLTILYNYGQYEKHYSSNQPFVNMKQPLLLLFLAVLTYFYFHTSDSPATPVAETESARPIPNRVASQTVVIASAPASYNRWKTGPIAQNDWKTGPTAQNDWKTGPNAQTNFEPFAPSEQATWNQTPGSTIVSGAGIRR